METGNRKQSRVAGFSITEKIRLITQMKQESVLWDLRHRRHFDSNYCKVAWDRVAITIGKDVSSCKAAWKSLRDSYRYHKSNKFKSGSAGGTPLESPGVSEEVQWEFAPFMDFLPDLSAKRKTYSSNVQRTDQDQVVDEEFVLEEPGGSTYLETDASTLVENELQLDMDLPDANGALYSYGKRPSKKRKTEELAENPATKMIEMFGDFLEAHSAPPVTAPVPAPSRPVLAYWDSLLSQLSPHDAIVAEHEMTNTLLGRFFNK